MEAKHITKTGLVFLMVLAASGCVNTNVPKREALIASAQNGDAAAQYAVGQSYCCGYGGGYSTVRAIEWFCKAAVQGYGPAQYQLGRIYGLRSDTAYRQSLRQDRIFAYMWYSLAALQEIPLADAERDALARDMSDRELAEARQHVRDWQQLACR